MDHEALIGHLSARLEANAVDDSEQRGWASVCVVLRYRPVVTANGSGKALELLYMKRAPNARDPWSGHVAFPGGKRDAGEDGLTAAMREAREEVGLDLAKDFHCLGYLCRIPTRGLMPVDAFVFLQKEDGEPVAFQLSVGEVFSVLWVPIAFFASCNVVTRTYKWQGQSFAFPTVMLPVNESHTLARNAMSNEEVAYQLWGLTLQFTLRVLNDMRFDLSHVFGMLYTRQQQKEPVPLYLDDDVKEAMLEWLASGKGKALQAKL